MFHEKYAYVRYRADEYNHDSYVRTIEGGRGSEQRDLPQSPGQPQPPERFRLSIALVLKQPVCRFVGLQR